MTEFVICGTRKDPHVSQIENILLAKGSNVLILDYLDCSSFSLEQSEKNPDQLIIDGNSISKKAVVWNRLKLREGSPFYFKEDTKGRAKLKMNQWLGFYNTVDT